MDYCSPAFDITSAIMTKTDIISVENDPVYIVHMVFIMVNVILL